MMGALFFPLLRRLRPRVERLQRLLLIIALVPAHPRKPYEGRCGS
jgi:hypothetical protein